MTPILNRATLTEGSWDDLFDFLDPNRHDRAGPDRDKEAEARCLEITRKLVCFFAGRGCADAEDLALDTILRVAGKCGAVAIANYDDRTGYFYGVARNVLHEWQRHALHEATKREALRQQPSLLPIPNPQSWKDKEAVDRCLEQCMAGLTQRAKRVILSYYAPDKTEKIECHRKLADEFGKSVNALRIEVHRIRNTLRDCVFGCLHPGAAGAGRMGSFLRG